ncbi:MAG: tetratricopeptide repeat protein [Gammaproteobacteria bacterium]
MTLLLILGVPFAATLAWYHGHKGHQRLGGQEIAVLAVLLVIAGCVLWLFGHPGEEHADSRSKAVAAAERASPEAKSLAVLPFDNRSGDKGQDFYADGLTDELTTALARISALKVIASASTARYKDSDKRPSEIAHDLDVANLVTGSVQRADGRIRYTASLVFADTEQNIWAESYERDERDVLTLQSEVAGAIAKAIAVRLSPAESDRLATARTVDPRAFEQYLLGRALWNQRTEQSIRAALRHFENSARVAPDFALAHAGVADSYILLGVHAYEPPRMVMPKAKAGALTAITLDPLAGEPHASLGDILFHFDWDWAAAERELEEAIRLAPAFATAFQWGSETQILSGDLEGALIRLRRARTIDPLSMIIRTSLANVLGLLGRREEAVMELREAIALDPVFARTRRELALQLLALGRTDEALAEARELARIAPDNLPSMAVLGLCLGRSGHATEARALLKKLEAKKGKPYISSLELARIAAGLQDRDLTIRYLQRAVEAREGFLPFIGGDDEFAFLRDDAHYQAIVRTIGIGERRGTPVSVGE